MAISSAREPTVSSVEQSVSQLASLIFRILEECNVDPKLLIDGLSELMDSDREQSKPSPVWAPSDLHLACTQVVFLWRRDPEFLDSDGNPRILAIVGESGSFQRLCERAAPGHQAVELLEYLISLGGAHRVFDGKVQVLSESVLACATEPGRRIAPATVLMHLQGFLGAVEYNLLRREGDPPARFERACYGEIPARLVPVFQQLVAIRGQNFIDSIDEWLDRHRSHDPDLAHTTRVGAGAYMLLSRSNSVE
jgi:hypothetical protein